MLKRVLIIMLLCLGFGSTLGRSEEIKKYKDVANIISMTPTYARIGDYVSFISTNCYPEVVEFINTANTVSDITTLANGNLKFLAQIPLGTNSGSVTIKTKTGRVFAGVLMISKTWIERMYPLPDEMGGGNGSSGSDLAKGLPASGFNKPFSPVVDGLDLPLDPPVFSKDKDKVSIKPPEPVAVPTPQPPEITPLKIYGKEFLGVKTVYYVIDISGSMEYEQGEFTRPDGQTAVGNRLDRAKAEATKSVLGLKKEVKFNMLSYDCGALKWRGQMVLATEANKQDALSWIRSLVPQGGTGTGPGVCFGLTEKPQVMLLLTDGMPNCGAGSEDGSQMCLDAHRAMIRNMNKGVTEIDVFGISASGEFKQFCTGVAGDNHGNYMDVR